MQQTGELDRVKARIKALAEKTVSNGCTEAEAMSAAEMVGRLLERYALTMGEIEVRESVCVQAEISTGLMRGRPIDGCLMSIARFCDCKVWRSSRDGFIKYVFFGFDADTTMAVYLYAVVERAIATELSGFRRANPRLRATNLRLATASFQHGMVARIGERLDAMLAAREACVAAQRETGTALMVVKHRVIDDAFRAEKIHLVSGGRRAVRHDTAYHQGFSAGDRANLGAPLGAAAIGARRLAS